MSEAVEKIENLKQKPKENIVQSFVSGARDGWNVFIKNVLPNVMMAYIFIQILQITKIMDLVTKIFGPVMNIFGLPGSSMAAFVAAIFSMGGGFATTAILFTKHQITAQQATIMMPAIALSGSLIQMWARILMVSGVPTKRHKWIILVQFIDAIIALLIMRVIVSVF